jgi:hypothetical protein
VTASAALGAFRTAGAWLDMHGVAHPSWERHWAAYNVAGDACARLGVVPPDRLWVPARIRVQPSGVRVPYPAAVA